MKINLAGRLEKKFMVTLHCAAFNLCSPVEMKSCKLFNYITFGQSFVFCFAHTLSYRLFKIIIICSTEQKTITPTLTFIRIRIMCLLKK